MSFSVPERRVRALEMEVAQLRELLELPERASEPWWEKTWGSFAGDQGFKTRCDSGVGIESSFVQDPGGGRAAPVTDHPHIERRPGVCGGSAGIEGTRIPVRLLVGSVMDGPSPNEILSSYTDLTPADVQAAIDYYADHREDVDREVAECDLSFVEQKFGLGLGSCGFLVPQA